MSNLRPAALLLALATPVAADDSTCPAVARTTRVHQRHRCGALEHDVQAGDVVLKGIVKTAKGYSALLEDCIDRKNWTVAAGQRLADGRVTAIDADGVTLEFDGPPPSYKLMTKRLTLKPAGK